MTAAPMPARPRQIPMDQAFTEAVAIVRDGLNVHGIRWNPEAEQDAVSTLMIQAGKLGMLLPWKTPVSEKSPIPINRPQKTLQVGAGAIAGDPARVSDPPASPPQEAPASAKTPNLDRLPKNTSAFTTMIRAFRQIEQEIPPEVWTAVLAWYGVQQPEDFAPEQIKPAAACYVALQRARDQYRSDQQTTVEHFEQIEEGWR